MIVRLTTHQDIPAVMALYENARQFMRDAGNPEQWGKTHPALALVEEDIALGQGYVCEENGRLLAAFALILGDDPTYQVIDGAWRNQRPYGTLHRLASSGDRPRMTDEIIRWAFERIPNLRVDTHEKNLPMQKALLRNGFVYCGTIWVGDGSPRMAYQKES